MDGDSQTIDAAPLVPGDSSSGYASEYEAAINARIAALLIAGVFVALSVGLSAQLILAHIRTWRKPSRQLRILIIVAMVPLFALDSYVGLWDVEAGEVTVTVLDAIKECYEAVVIVSFLGLMFDYIFGPTVPNTILVIPDHLKGRELHHSFPVSLFSHGMLLDATTVQTLRIWTLQFAILRPVLSLVVVALEMLRLYEGPVAWVITAALNVSVSYAVYALLLFYHAFATELGPYRPLAKLLCIKMVVFFATWQGIGLKVLVATGILHQGHLPYTVTQVEEAIQNFLVCIEALFFALAHRYAYGVDEFITGDANKADDAKKTD